MESLVFTWRLLLLISTFAFPLLFGILLYFRLSWAPRWVVAIVAGLAPAVVFFFLAPLFFFAGMREAYAHGDRCGTPAIGAFFLLFTGTTVQLVLGLFTQMVLSARSRRRPRN